MCHCNILTYLPWSPFSFTDKNLFLTKSSSDIKFKDTSASMSYDCMCSFIYRKLHDSMSHSRLFRSIISFLLFLISPIYLKPYPKLDCQTAEKRQHLCENYVVMLFGRTKHKTVCTQPHHTLTRNYAIRHTGTTVLYRACQLPSTINRLSQPDRHTANGGWLGYNINKQNLCAMLLFYIATVLHTSTHKSDSRM